MASCSPTLQSKSACKTAYCKMQKVLVALMALGANAFAPSAAPRATVVQQGVPLANGAMEFDRGAPASA